MPIGKSDRGFYQYAEFIDTYRGQVRVYESSAAMAPHVWVSIQSHPDMKGDPGEGTSHLSVEQATILRDALTEWIDQIPERWNLSEGEGD